MVAQKFIDQHQLPQDHLDQVANFIISNSKASAGPPPPSDYFDPFTGGNRYSSVIRVVSLWYFVFIDKLYIFIISENNGRLGEFIMDFFFFFFFFYDTTKTIF